RLVAGTMGGELQPQIHASLLARVLARGERVDGALRAPRWAVSLEPGRDDPSIALESGVPEAARRSLARVGALEDLGAASETLGHAQLIEIGPGGFEAGSDPRADGSAWAR
ncbi:MAG TPA: gamma-glutamyltransferase, partial [Actinomycetota bacterium]|nr:gamma-glutamyltransferase [Actinomycetota bacterium]